MTAYKSLIAVFCLFASASPALAINKDLVEFKFQPHELESADKRVALLERIKAQSAMLCTPSSAFTPAISEEQCRKELEHQFINAIGNAELRALAYSDKVKAFKSASR